MALIRQSVFFDAAPAAVFSALATTEGHKAFTGAEAAISEVEGGAWSAWGGGVHGRNIEIVPNQRLVQAWRAADWEPGVYSVVSFELEAEGTGTRLILQHRGAPEGTEVHLGAGWHSRYWEPLRAHLAG